MSKKLTTAAGCPVVDNQNTMTAGPRGPALLQDVWLLEKLAHFDREVIPERRMHAKGSGAYGTLPISLKRACATCARSPNSLSRSRATSTAFKSRSVAIRRTLDDAARMPRE